MRTQQEIEEEVKKQKAQIKFCNRVILKSEASIRELEKESSLLDDPHDLIPVQYETFEEWEKDGAIEGLIEGMRFKNKYEANQVRISCYTFEYEYKIVKSNRTVK